ncbi:MJ0042-type zinc finger domain-containing protein [Brevundimonas sp. SORGH_AS_0993]|uniref:MJ0042-type zinc finger domain-containing protein n=1 Tax=Brevundimonas sp. SORGH_AS_0993 TaxID=3041794 RepID=UPI00277EDDB2|nr:MJ0042-type zinc finger domain-containing protein [Brevundimonas sp. SORGH_AS_0993]MDQ1154461.1 putative Zn finger-like uncharacterized protein [Brevundimonas sp. SORGH_AS_0993]
MILTCPACATSYFIPDDAMGPNGRKVRCQACGEVWRATSEDPLELTLSPEPRAVASAESATPPSSADPEPESLAETPAPELPKAFRARAEQQRRLRRAAAHGVVWAGLAAVFIGLIVSAFLFRVEIVRLLPRAASAYALAGIEVNTVGLDFEALSAKPAPNLPGMVVVSGALRNVRDAEITAPPVRVALLDDHGAEVGVKIVRIDAAPVLPGKVQGFAALIPDPSGHAAGIKVDFVEPAPAPAPGPHAVVARPGPHAEAPAQAPAKTESAAPATGLRSAVSPGVTATAPVDAKPVAPAEAAVDKGHGSAVSAGHHG